jgi:hypothetical protein
MNVPSSRVGITLVQPRLRICTGMVLVMYRYYVGKVRIQFPDTLIVRIPVFTDPVLRHGAAYAMAKIMCTVFVYVFVKLLTITNNF